MKKIYSLILVVIFCLLNVSTYASEYKNTRIQCDNGFCQLVDADTGEVLIPYSKGGVEQPKVYPNAVTNYTQLEVEIYPIHNSAISQGVQNETRGNFEWSGLFATVAKKGIAAVGLVIISALVVAVSPAFLLAYGWLCLKY